MTEPQPEARKLLTGQERQPTQKTRPKKGKSVEIPVPTRKEAFGLIDGVTGQRSTAQEPKRRLDG